MMASPSVFSLSVMVFVPDMNIARKIAWSVVFSRVIRVFFAVEDPKEAPAFTCTCLDLRVDHFSV